MEEYNTPASTHPREICPQATHLLSLLGEPVNDAYLEAFASRYGSSLLRDLCTQSTVVNRFKQLTEGAQKREYWEVLELLILEHWIGARPYEIAQKLPSTESLASHVMRLRMSIGLALYAQAKAANWQEPLTFSRGLRAAEAYLTTVHESQHLFRAKTASLTQGRLGVTVVLQSRYVEISSRKIEEAVAHLRSSYELGDRGIEAVGYLAEAYLRQHDRTGEVEPLQQAVKLAQHTELDRSEGLASHLAEAWARLSQAASTDAGREECTRRALQLCDRVDGGVPDPVARARSSLVAAFLNSKQRDTLTLRGLNTPFGVGRQVETWRRTDRRATLRLLADLESALERLPRSALGHPLIRRILSGIKSERGALFEGVSWKDQKVQLLTSAVQLRSEKIGTWGALKDPDSRLQNAVDHFELFRATDSRAFLLSAVREVVALAQFDQAWPTPLLVLARELERLDGPMPLQVAYELRKHEDSWDRSLLRSVLESEVGDLYERAAARALESREIDGKHLGGRSGVYLAEDFAGIVAESFVFKPTTVALAKREDMRASRLTTRLWQMGLSEWYSVPATLAQSPLPMDDVLRAKGAEVLVARRFHKGDILDDALYGKDLASRTKTLDAVAKFLAIIHASESVASEEPMGGARRELWKKDFGRWLKTGLKMPNADDFFSRWWSIFGSEPVLLPRRDAHPLNWLVGLDGSIVAVDFEATGWRPLGYEIAQLLDDRPLLPLDDNGWGARLHLVRQYRRELKRRGVDVDGEQLRRNWEASALARAVGLLTAPSGDPILRDHGEQLLHRLMRDSAFQGTRTLADEVWSLWQVRRGTVARDEDQLRTISDARRRHLSRAMAYELRHGDTVFLDKGGWGYIAAVSDALHKSGIRTSSAEVLTVAAAIDEPRFEVEGKKVRARYGHTRNVDITYETPSIRPALYHGTSVKNLDAIFSAGEGLRAMGRKWVHLSSDPDLAVRTARRHGPGVLLGIDPKVQIEEFFHAGGTVYLSPAVRADALRIVSPTELFLESGRRG